ncbi:MAG: MFS transporter [Planctomycetaceae bacterium]
MSADGFAFSIMVGIGETYLPAFVLSSGKGELAAALIATVPILAGSLLQLVAPTALRYMQSYRRFVVLTAALQAGSLLGLMLTAIRPQLPTWTVFLFATLYWAAGLSTGPAWNTWAEELVPSSLRAGFFARRGRLSHFGVLLGLVLGGVLLKFSTSLSNPLLVFAWLFGIAAASRFVSAAMLARQSEGSNDRTAVPRLRRTGPNVESIGMLNRLKTSGPAERFILYLVTVQTAVYIAGPYFTPYMLGTLKLSWIDYMILLSLCFIGKMLALPWAAKLANRAGVNRLMWIGGLGVIPTSALWMISQTFWSLAAFQIYSGLVWACYELSMLLQFFRQIPIERRVRVLTIYNLGNSAAMVLGSLIGAVFLSLLGRNGSAYLMLFGFSSVARLASLLLIPGRRAVVQSTVQSTTSALRVLVSRTIAVRPMAGSLERPVLPAFDRDAEAAPEDHADSDIAEPNTTRAAS